MTNIHTQKNRSPVVAIMGHVDHGKSTLLDYIRKSNVVATEAGGITQHISAYEVELSEGKRITFLDTPGHAAFDSMRHRGGTIADIAILIISAEDGVKTQTQHAIEVIKKNNIPFIVAISKIDKPEAQPEKVKTDLLEEGIYVEGYGGNVPFVSISTKTGQGIDDLLESLLIIAEMEEMTGDISIPATGYVVESNQNPKEGITATLIIKNGTIRKGQYVVVNDSLSPTRMLKDFTGKVSIDSAYFSSPICLTGFSTLPTVGSRFTTFNTKKEAEQAISEFKDILYTLGDEQHSLHTKDGTAIVPLIIKTDVAGTAEAINFEINKRNNDEVFFKIIKSETGNINESDIKLALSDQNTVVIGFNIQEESVIKNLNGYESVPIHHFSIIYKLTEWIDELYEQRRIKKEIETVTGSLHVLKIFSQQKDKLLVGGSLNFGELGVGHKVHVKRKNEIVGNAKIVGLQQGKSEVQKVSSEGTECGVMLQTDLDIQEHDTLESYISEIK